MANKYVIFGAGKFGLRAIEEYGRENILCIIDNDENKIGSSIKGLPVFSLDQFLSEHAGVKIIIAVNRAERIVKQLCEVGYNEFVFFRPSLPQFQSYWPSDKLVIDYNANQPIAKDEDEWVTRQNAVKNQVSGGVSNFIRNWYNSPMLFRHVEIETYNRCNGGCSFCPVSVKNESRPEKLMEEKLFKKIIKELAEMDYSGRLSLFSNNEPFLDERILRFHKYARECIPNARMHLYTNGTKLSLEKFDELMNYLDELIIDNYSNDGKLIPNNEIIRDYCKEHPELISKVTILLRKQDEILTSRGGDAPNRNKKVSFSDAPCMLPFRQMIIRPDGKVSLCCNDPLGKNTLGDINKQSMQEVWYGKEYSLIRKCLAAGRGNWGHCVYCDTFILD